MHKERVETFLRGEEGVWTLQNYTLIDGMFELNSLQFQGSFEVLYEDVFLDTEPASAEDAVN